MKYSGHALKGDGLVIMEGNVFLNVFCILAFCRFALKDALKGVGVFHVIRMLEGPGSLKNGLFRGDSLEGRSADEALA